MVDPLLLIMSLIMMIASVCLFVIGYKKNVTNILIWILIPFCRGIQWFIEYIDDSLADPPLILDKVILIFAFLSSLFLFSAITEYTQILSERTSKQIIIPIGCLYIYFVLIIPNALLVSIEDLTLFKGFLLVSDPFRLFYGFILPFSSFLVLIQALRNQISDGSVSITRHRRSLRLISIFLLLFAIFEGLDYENELYIFIRSVVLVAFVFLPILIILSDQVGLRKFLIVSEIGIPLYVYDFVTGENQHTNNVILTSGFIVALMSLSEEISKGQTSLSIKSNKLYYSIIKSGSQIYILQSISVKDRLLKSYNTLMRIIRERYLNSLMLNDDISLDITSCVKSNLKEFLDR